jgi:hypothetical protein
MTIASLMVSCAEAIPTKFGATLKARIIGTAYLLDIAILHGSGLNQGFLPACVLRSTVVERLRRLAVG